MKDIYNKIKTEFNSKKKGQGQTLGRPVNEPSKKEPDLEKNISSIPNFQISYRCIFCNKSINEDIYKKHVTSYSDFKIFYEKGLSFESGTKLFKYFNNPEEQKNVLNSIENSILKISKNKSSPRYKKFRFLNESFNKILTPVFSFTVFGYFGFKIEIVENEYVFKYFDQEIVDLTDEKYEIIVLERLNNAKMLYNDLEAFKPELYDREEVVTLMKGWNKDNDKNLTIEDFELDPSEIKMIYKLNQQKIEESQELKLRSNLNDKKESTNYKKTKIKFRLDTNKFIEASFLPQETVEDLYKYISQHVSGKIILSKKSITEGVLEDMKQTIFETGLHPRGAVYQYKKN